MSDLSSGGVHYNIGDIQEGTVLRILSENYGALYFVDFDEDKILPCRMSKTIADTFGDYFNTQPPYKEAMTKYIKSEVSPLDQDEMLKRADPDFIRKEIGNKRSIAYDFRINRGGKEYYYRFKLSKLTEGEELHQAAVGFADVTAEMDRINELSESKAMLEVLRHDKLTGLYTKEFFYKLVKERIDANPDTRYMMWATDILGLKVVNEKYGLETGDEVLRVLASRNVKSSKQFLCGRIDGDKFAALVEDTEEMRNAIKSLNTDNIPFPVPNIIIKNGLYYIPEDCTLSPQGMYDRALLALMSIKDKYGVNCAEYNDDLRKDLLNTRLIVEEAEKALRENQFQIFFQPKFDLIKGRTGGAEALVRWIHPEMGFMNPGVFIPVFEKNGFITRLDFYVWEKVCRIINDWKASGLPPIPVSVNVSRRDFELDTLAEEIIRLTDRYNVDHSLFHIEITESAYADNPEALVKVTKKLHEAGFVIELDDFGTGYSSMVALSSLDLDIMKLDMSIVQNDIPGTDKNILEFSMQLAKMMKLKTVAEGVETPAQSERIKSLGGDFIQGYLYSKPLPREQFDEYVRQEIGNQKK